MSISTPQKVLDAVRILGEYCGKDGAYDYVDDYVEVRLYDELLETFEEGLDETKSR